jgi:hypothetical protein
MRWKPTLAIAIAVLLAAASPAAAVTFTITGFGDDGNGICQNGVAGGDCTTIRAALATARETPGTETDIIELPAGDYQLAAGPLQIGSPVTLRGAGARTTTILASPNSRVLEIDGAAARIERLTVTGGVATDLDGFHGGNIRAQSSTVELDHVRVTNGRAYSGGGIANRNGTMLITNSLIDHNRAPDGGGDGGGIINFGGDSGAAASLIVRDTTVAFNRARLAGGIISYPNPQNSLTLESATVARNAADDSGSGGGPIGVGGIQVSAESGTFTSRGSLIADNVLAGGATQNCAQTPATSQGGNLESAEDCGFSAPADRVGVSPQLDTALSDLGGETDVLAFPVSSPAIDVGGQCSSIDQRGSLRPIGLGCDAGAYEYLPGLPPPPPEPTPTPTPPPVPTPAPIATPTPEPTPVAGKSVGAESVKGKVLVKVPGSEEFVELDDSVIKNGALVDTRKGTVEITRSDGQVAKFFDGIFKLTQAGGITTLTLSEQLDCRKKGKASAAAKKPKTRKLWGDGKGKFRTRGQYSAATVRGTKWLVTDTCTSTITKVSQGVVKVRDEVKKKTIIVRKGKSYTARPKR